MPLALPFTMLARQSKAKGMALFLTLDNGAVIKLANPLNPSSWTAPDGSPALPLLVSLFPSTDTVFISIAQQSDGQHRFVQLKDAADGPQHPTLRIVAEADIAKDQSTLLFARPEEVQSSATDASAATDLMALVKDDMTPKKMRANYSVVPWLCLGRTARVLLSDENTLTGDHTRDPDPIMEHVTLIVNCHEEASRTSVSKYFPHGRAGENRLELVAHAVHTWHSFDGTPSVTKNDQIQAAIWAHLERGGSVAVHCLAGIHRAACIVVSAAADSARQVLFLHLAHSHLPSLLARPATFSTGTMYSATHMCHVRQKTSTPSCSRCVQLSLRHICTCSKSTRSTSRRAKQGARCVNQQGSRQPQP